MTDSNGTTEPAGAGLSDAEFAEQVAGQTASDLNAESVFEREHDGATTDTPVAEIDGDDLAEGSTTDEDLDEAITETHDADWD